MFSFFLKIESERKITVRTVTIEERRGEERRGEERRGDLLLLVERTRKRDRGKRDKMGMKWDQRCCRMISRVQHTRHDARSCICSLSSSICLILLLMMLSTSHIIVRICFIWLLRSSISCLACRFSCSNCRFSCSACRSFCSACRFSCSNCVSRFCMS